MENEILSALLSNPELRDLIESVALKVATGVVADILHRRATDPDFLGKSDQVFSQVSQAQTDQEKQDAQAALAALMSGT